MRKKILVADACDKMWPPIGFNAPPATNVMVAPGSATHGVGVVSERVRRNRHGTDTALG